MRTLIPTLTEALGTNDFVEKARGRKKLLDQKQKARYDSSAKDLKPFEPGTLVWIQNADTGKWDDMGKIMCQVRKRTYKLELDNGRTTHRNRKRIRRRKIPPIGSSDECQGYRGQKPLKAEDVEIGPRRSERIRKKTNKQ